jgi:hypothetical protein
MTEPPAPVSYNAEELDPLKSMGMVSCLWSTPDVLAMAMALALYLRRRLRVAFDM